MGPGSVALELRQPRRLIVLAAIAAAGIAAVRAGTADWPGWLSFGSLLAAYTVAVGLLYPALRKWKRPTGMVVSRHGFAVPLPVPSGPTYALLLVVLGLLAGSAVQSWREVAWGDLPVGYAVAESILVSVLAAVMAVLLASFWRGFTIELTPTAIQTHIPTHHRTIPWSALASDGPLEIERDARGIRLVVGRPDLVVQRGWHPLCGTRQRPRLDSHVHSMALAAAIRWYAEHPEHRPAIGTPAELERLTGQRSGT
jgi:hypothetical protein